MMFELNKVVSAAKFLLWILLLVSNFRELPPASSYLLYTGHIQMERKTCLFLKSKNEVLLLESIQFLYLFW